MKPVEKLLEAARATLTTSLPTQHGEQVADNVTPLEDEARQAVRRIFATLKTAFPAWYEKHYGDAKAEQMARRVWLTVIKDFGTDAINAGLHRMVAECKFPPAPSDFVVLCKRLDALPDEAQAWDEALRGSYSHKAVQIAAEATSTFDLKSGTYTDKALRQRFERNYAIVMRRAQTGQPLQGHIAHGVGHDSMRDPRQVQLEHSRKEGDRILDVLEIPKDPKACRAMLLAKLGIRRNANV
ncbi:replication protein P [Pseudomonas syringae]|uniref:replication protein P n=1 Tax=Pseudomonas syringae TaxID=317 RepID=UPI001EEEEC17|nr:replication protein P [Pseudomonas syringae]GKQ44397.1 Replication protein P [Pseudomonas syringae pv. theae]